MTRLTVVTLNTRGTPLRGLAHRYRTIADALETSRADVINLQEVLTYAHLHLLRRSMPTYQANFQPSAAGPAGGLVTFTRSRGTTSYQRLPAAYRNGILRTHVPEVTVFTTHLRANRDGDWSPTNRFYPIHQAQLSALARHTAAKPAVLTGDFNVARDTTLYRDFLRESGLVDAFASCPPTFHRAYLPPGRSAHCIDYVLISGAAVVESAQLDGDYASDHLGLQVRLRFHSTETTGRGVR
ncbi:endonuclease/exonuclease/phosphatase family protein [Kribbella sp. WER1]